jgi:hypothetical protein
MRLPGPVGVTDAGSVPVSARARRAAGMTRVSGPAVAGEGAGSTVGGGVGAGASWGADAGVGSGEASVVGGSGEVVAAATSRSSMSPMTSPTSAVSPFGLRIFVITPAAGAGSSAVTLSVSRTTTGSSGTTVSPSCFSQSPR